MRLLRPAAALFSLRRRVTLLVVAAGMLAGCKAKVGDACTRGQAACADPTTELSCQGGKLVAAPCKGPLGCALREGTVACDISGNASGDACSRDEDGKATCTSDRRARVECASGRYRVLPCRGPAGCSSSSNRISCDTSTAEAGDGCELPPPDRQRHACATDHRALLACRGGTFGLEQPCRGPDGCNVKDGTPYCDVSIAAIGDHCGVEGQHACSVDGRAVLTCKGGVFGQGTPCPGAKGCALLGEKIVCDPGD